MRFGSSTRRLAGAAALAVALGSAAAVARDGTSSADADKPCNSLCRRWMGWTGGDAPPPPAEGIDRQATASLPATPPEAVLAALSRRSPPTAARPRTGSEHQARPLARSAPEIAEARHHPEPPVRPTTKRAPEPWVARLVLEPVPPVPEAVVALAGDRVAAAPDAAAEPGPAFPAALAAPAAPVAPPPAEVTVIAATDATPAPDTGPIPPAPRPAPPAAAFPPAFDVIAAVLLSSPPRR